MEDFKKIMIDYLTNRVKGKQKSIDVYPGLTTSKMNSNNDELFIAIQIFLTVVHALEPVKSDRINYFLFKGLPVIKNEKDFRKKAYVFLESIIK